MRASCEVQLARHRNSQHSDSVGRHRAVTVSYVHGVLDGVIASCVVVLLACAVYVIF